MLKKFFSFKKRTIYKSYDIVYLKENTPIYGYSYKNQTFHFLEKNKERIHVFSKRSSCYVCQITLCKNDGYNRLNDYQCLFFEKDYTFFSYGVRPSFCFFQPHPLRKNLLGIRELNFKNFWVYPPIQENLDRKEKAKRKKAWN